jgi:hypothetical protein
MSGTRYIRKITINEIKPHEKAVLKVSNKVLRWKSFNLFFSILFYFFTTASPMVDSYLNG